MKYFLKVNHLFVVGSLSLGLLLIVVVNVVNTQNIEDDKKWAWGTNIGWINLGTYTDGGRHTYSNSATDSYGVNRDLWNNLSGYAWSTNAGWIKFNPTFIPYN
jgi:hypothetical protein